MAGGKKSEPIVVAQIMGKWVGGGVEAVIMNYYRHIDRTKVQFDFICDEDSTNIPYEEIEKLGGHVILCPPYQKLFKYMKFLENLFREKKYRIVHSNINTLSVFPLRAAKKAGVKVRIAHSHSTSNPKEWKKNLLKNALRPFSRKYATDYFACSELAGRYLFGDKVFNAGKVKIIHNAIDAEKFKYDPEARKRLRKEIGIKEDDFVIGHIGRFVQQKNHGFLIDAFVEVKKERKNARLVLVGQGPLMDEIKMRVAKLGLEKDVLFLGQRDDVEGLYSLFDIFCLPSLYEGLGLVLIEAQSAGLPCIVSNNVPKIAKIRDNVVFLGISRGDRSNWASLIKSVKIKDRGKKNPLTNNYDIYNEAGKLQDIIVKKNKIKICHVVSGLRAGGVESMIYNYCSRMDASKIDFSILYQHDPSRKNVDEFGGINFDLVRVADKRKKPLLNYRETYRYLKDNNIDVVHCHMTLMNIIPLLAAKRAGVRKRICHSHATDIDGRNFVITIIERIIKKACISFATDLYACGEEAGRYMYGNKKYTVINNALPLKKYKYNCSARKKIRSQYRIGDKDRVILHVGRFEEQKNHRFLIDSIENILKENKDYWLIMIGDGPLKEDIEQLVSDNDVPNVLFVGTVTNIGDFYSACDLFVLPSKYEGLPVSALEAQVSGCKCLLSKNIDKKVIVLEENVKLINNSKEAWEKEYLDSSNYTRKENLDAFDKKYLNIDIEYKKLEKNYISTSGVVR